MLRGGDFPTLIGYNIRKNKTLPGKTLSITGGQIKHPVTENTALGPAIDESVTPHKAVRF